MTAREEIEELLVDCYNEDEQRAAWEVAFTEGVAVPFRATLLGMPVEVGAFRVNDANAVQCQVKREDKQRWVGVDDLDEAELPAEMQPLLNIYHAWLEGDY